MDLTLADTQINAVTSNNTKEAFYDSMKLDNTAISSAQDYPFLPSRLPCLPKR